MRNRTKIPRVEEAQKFYFQGMGRADQFEIRLYRDDGTLSVVMPYVANDAYIATLEAQRMLNGELTTAQIWHDYKLVRTLEY